MHTEPGMGTDGCRTLGEIRPRTVRPDGGAAPHHPGKQPGRHGVQTLYGLAESIGADGILHPASHNGHHSGCAARPQGAPKAGAGAVGRHGRVHQPGAVEQPAGGGDGIRERPADGQDARTPVPAAENTHGGLREDRETFPEPFRPCHLQHTLRGHRRV